MKRAAIRYRIVLITVLMVALPFLTSAAVKSEADVRAAVTTWVQRVTADARPDAFVQDIEPYSVNGRTVAYIVHLSGDGFCLCGADEATLPVYYYSPHGRYDSTNSEYRFILEEIAEQDASVRGARDQGITLTGPQQQALSRRTQQWSELAAGLTNMAQSSPALPSSDPLMMELDMNSLWTQVSPYNDMCPVLTPGSDEHCVAGCVATAMAQVMYYWKWPTSGTGSNGVWYRFRWRDGWNGEPLATDPGIPAYWAGGLQRLQWTAANGGLLIMNGYWDSYLYAVAKQINSSTAYLNALQALYNRLTRDSTWYSADFGSIVYNWLALHDVHTDPVDDGDAEAARITYHAGLASNTSYASGFSSGDTGPMRNGFVNYMRYDPDAWYRSRDASLIVEEITWLRPVIAGGYSQTGGGHQWVIFGYNMQTSPWQFKMNLGLYNTPTGWYSLDNFTYNIAQDQALRIAPMGVVRFVGGSNSPTDGSPSDPYQTLDQALGQVPNGTTLIMKAGTTQTLTGGQLNRPMILKGKDVTVQP